MDADKISGPGTADIYRKLVELASEGFWLLDKKFLTVYVSPALEQLLGYTKEEMSGRSWHDFGDPAWVARAKELEHRREQGIKEPHEFLFIRKDGRKILTRITTTPLYDAAGNFDGAIGVLSDITGQKEAAVLAADSARVEILMEVSPTGIVCVDAAGAITYVNRRGEELLGLSRQALAGRPYNSSNWNATHPDGTPFLDEELPFTRVKRTKQPVRNMEEVIEWKDGRKVTLSVNGTPLMSDTGEFLGMIASVEDISERKKAEETLRQSNAVMDKIQNLAKIGGWEYDLVSQKMFWTKETYLLHDMVPGDIKPGSAEHISKGQQCYRPEDIPVVMAAFNRCKEAGTPYDLELPFTTVKGRQLWIRTTAQAEWDGDRLVKVVGSLQDITERKLAEETLRDSEEKYQKIFQSAPLLVALSGIADGRYVDCNKQFFHVLGFKREEVIGRTSIELGIFTPEVRSTLLSNRNNIQGLELTVRTKDGRLITCAFYAEIVKVAGVDHLLSMAIDVTERNSAAERMRVLHADLMEKNKDMESFLYLTTHDLRTPLVNMLGYSKQLGSDIKNLQAALSCAALPKEIKGKVLGLVDESITKSLMFISESAIKMDLMINGLLKMARLGRMEITAVRLDMNVLLQKVHAALSYQLEKAGCAFKVEALPPCISDPSVMIHVFTNLINNAVKYRHRGRKLEITVRGEIKDGKTAIYTVSDNGQGIKASDLDKIGQMFFRGYLQDPAIEQGEGIGIAMVKRMLARTGGTLAVRSTEGVGTQIYVELPSEKAG